MKTFSKSLIIRKEYLDLFFYSGKIWELRTTKTKIKGIVGFIESGSGLIVGCGNLITSHCLSTPTLVQFSQYHQVKNIELLKRWNCPWVFNDIKKFDVAIPYDHPQGAVIWVNHPPVNFI